MYVIQPIHSWWRTENLKGGRRLPDGFHYGSENNSKWLTSEELRAMAEDVPENEARGVRG